MSSTCSHLYLLSSISPPTASQVVHKDECTQCFDNQDGELGVDVCLTCFNGGCTSSDRNHAAIHHQKSSHPFSVNIKRTRKKTDRTDEEPPAKLAKLAIVPIEEKEKWNYVATLRCWGCAPDQSGRLLSDASSNPIVEKLINGVLNAKSSSASSDVKPWEDVIAACEHTLMIPPPSSPIPQSIPTECSVAGCGLKENLWLCLTCGNIGCGRSQFGGLAGNGHALAHATSNLSHSIAVKQGTITPEGTADLFCYTCGDSVLDPELPFHLSLVGIEVGKQEKTEKSTTELEVEKNLSYDFSLISSTGEVLKPVFGPGLTGLRNLGNSCYMASIIQILFALPAFRRRYLPTATLHSTICTNPLPSTCLSCQMHKLADGLLSGRYSHPRPEPDPALITEPKEGEPVFQEGLGPRDFKALVGKGHPEFSTMKQQDAEEFFGWLMESLRRHEKAQNRGEASDGMEPTETFRFGVEEKLRCGGCSRVRVSVVENDVGGLGVASERFVRVKSVEEDGKRKVYEEVKVEEVIESWMGEEELDWVCEECKRDEKVGVSTKRTRFASFPDTLVLHAKRFRLENWVPVKLDIPVLVPHILDLSHLLGSGLSSSDTPLPDSASASSNSASKEPEVDQDALAQLEGMGFPRVRCMKALLATNGQGPEAAMEWLFAHMDDADIDDPLPSSAAGDAGAKPPMTVNEEDVLNLVDMGFEDGVARRALVETDGNMERAVEWLFSHPDATPLDTSSSSSSAPAPASTSKTPAGSKTLPAKYKLKAFVSHKGPSVHSGHYVAHIRVGDGREEEEKGDEKKWILFNDEKVVEAEWDGGDDGGVEQLMKSGYLWVFERI